MAKGWEFPPFPNVTIIYKYNNLEKEGKERRRRRRRRREGLRTVHGASTLDERGPMEAIDFRSLLSLSLSLPP